MRSRSGSTNWAMPRGRYKMISSCPSAPATSPAESSGTNAGRAITKIAPSRGPARSETPPMTVITTTSMLAEVGKALASTSDNECM